MLLIDSAIYTHKCMIYYHKYLAYITNIHAHGMSKAHLYQ